MKGHTYTFLITDVLGTCKIDEDIYTLEGYWNEQWNMVPVTELL